MELLLHAIFRKFKRHRRHVANVSGCFREILRDAYYLDLQSLYLIGQLRWAFHMSHYLRRGRLATQPIDVYLPLLNNTLDLSSLWTPFSRRSSDYLDSALVLKRVS